MNIVRRILLAVACLSSVVLLPLHVRAEFMPPTLPDLNGYNIPGFLMDAYSTDMVSHMGVGIQPNDVERANQLINGRSVNDSISYHYIDNASIRSPLTPFVDANGNIVSQSDTYTAFGYSDIGSFSFVVDKQTGQILDTYDNYQNLVSTMSFGNFSMTDLLGGNPNASQQRRMQEAMQEAIDNNMIVFSNQISSEDAEKLSRYEYYLTATFNAYGGMTVYVPNACTMNTVVTNYGTQVYEYHGTVEAGSDASWYRPLIYTNSPNEVFYSSNGQYNYLVSQQMNVYGTTFAYRSALNEGFMSFYQGGYLDMKIPTQAEYINYRMATTQAVYLQPATNDGEVTNVYNYTYLTNDNTRPSPIINHNYDNRTDTNYYNYPVTNNVTYPDYSVANNNYYETIYNYYTSPNVKEEIEADPELIGNNIPILSNLQSRFPFSIPWDIAKMLKSLEAEREAPVIEGSIYFPVINYTWNCSLDLSMFEDSAELFRKVVLILFIVGLAVFSYSHHFGS